MELSNIFGYSSISFFLRLNKEPGGSGCNMDTEILFFCAGLDIGVHSNVMLIA
jgi:hypothetical protein